MKGQFTTAKAWGCANVSLNSSRAEKACGWYGGHRRFTAVISNSNCSEDQERSYKETRGRWRNNRGTWTSLLHRNSFHILFPAKGIVGYRQIILAVCTFFQMKRVHSLAEHLVNKQTYMLTIWKFPKSIVGSTKSTRGPYVASGLRVWDPSLEFEIWKISQELRMRIK